MKMRLLGAGLKTACSALVLWLVFPALLCGAELQELARRIDMSVRETFDAAQKEKFAEPILKHSAVTLQLISSGHENP